MARIPVTILGGFLGSGKTTMLNYLLKADHGRRIAVIVNEFGEVGIDGAVASGGEQFVELDNGCLCCALNEDLERTVTELKDRGGFEHLVLETTGLADPLPVAWTFSRPGLSDAYRTDAVVVVVDSKHLDVALAQGREASDQLARADLLILNKSDLVDTMEGVEAKVREFNELAPMLHASFGQVPWDVVLTTDEPSRLAYLKLPPDSAHSHFETWHYEVDGVLSDEAFEDFLFELPDSVYRFKALVRTDAEWEWTLANAVAGRVDMHPITPERPPSKGRIVFIGKKLDVEELKGMCAELVGAGQ